MSISVLEILVAVAVLLAWPELVVDRRGARVDRRCAGGCAYHADRGAYWWDGSAVRSKRIRRSRRAPFSSRSTRADYEVALERARAELADAEAAGLGRESVCRLRRPRPRRTR